MANKKRKRKLKPTTEKNRLENDFPRYEYLWLNSINSGNPDNFSNFPKGLNGISIKPDETIAWIKKNCKFARN